MQADLLDLQGSLFSAQLELQGLQRAQQQGQRREEDLARANQRLQTDLQRALQQHQEGERHNQDLQAALEKARLEVQQMEEKWRDEWRQREKEVEERERTIRELKTSLEHKERLIEVRHAKNILIISPSISTDRLSVSMLISDTIYSSVDQDYSELVDCQKEPVGNRDNLIHKFKKTHSGKR